MKTFLAGPLLLLAACSAQPASEAVAPPPVARNAPAPAAAPASAPPALAPAPAAPAPAPADAPAGPALAVESEGLRLFDRATGSASPIPFGRPQAEALAVLERLRGPAGRGTNADCGAGPVQYANWPDGLGLVFQAGRFAGWSLDGRAGGALSTANGIGPGMTRTQLEAASPTTFRKSTLGTEFDAGGVYGVLDGAGPRARITDMWAGVNCVAR